MSEFNLDRRDSSLYSLDTSNPERFLETLAHATTIPELNRDTLTQLREHMSPDHIMQYYTLLYEIADKTDGRITIDPDLIIKPKSLFHASTNGAIEEFEPRQEKRRDEHEPAQVFAAPSLSISSMFLVPGANDFTKSGSYDTGRTWTYIIGDLEKFKQLDAGGWIYTLPEDTFSVDPNKGLGLFEWTSQQSVQPTSKQYYPSALAALQEFNVQVYAVEKETFELLQSEDHDDIKILEQLEPLFPVKKI